MSMVEDVVSILHHLNTPTFQEVGMPAIDSTSHLLIGNKYGRLTIIGVCRVPCKTRWEGTTTVALKWRCECGTEGQSRKWSILKGERSSCGCWQREKIGALNRTHGQTYTNPVYGIWRSMIQRCTDHKCEGFKRYGGRGIKVCDRWQGKDGFTNFLADMGERPEGLMIERVNNDGDYEPGNCRWATRKEQNRNTRKNRMLTHNDKTQPISAWAEELGISAKVIADRINKLGWSVEDALTTPTNTNLGHHHVSHAD